MSSRGIIASVLAIGMLFSLFGTVSLNVRGDQGGADGWGYFWTDSDDPPPKVAYNWTEISGTGTHVPLYGDNEASGPLSIGFDFTFYGTSFSRFFVGTNGILGFESNGLVSSENLRIPLTRLPDGFIAPLWDDLCVNYSGYNWGAVYYQNLGTSPNQQLVVEWWQISQVGSSNLLTFEVVLNENGDIWFEYQELNGMTGATATVGLENMDGTDGCLYSFEQGVLHNSLGIEFTRSSIGFGPDMSGYGPREDTARYDLFVTNNQAAADKFDITNVSDLGWAVGLYNESMVPLQDTNGDGDPDTGEIAPGGSMPIIVTISVPAGAGATPEVTTLTAQSNSAPGNTEDAVLTTYVSPAKFAPPHSDAGYDGDSDGFFDDLVVTINMSMEVAGSYGIDARLQDAFHNEIYYTQIWTAYGVGANSFDLWFSGYLINTSDVNGPYHLDLMLLIDGYVPVDRDLHTTAAYNVNQFEHPPGTLDPPVYDNGADTDSDGLYEYLALNVTLSVSEPGGFLVIGYIMDSIGNIITGAYEYAYFDVGDHLYTYSFSGAEIRDFGADGPYKYYIGLNDGGGLTQYDEDRGTTGAYTWDQFEGGGGPGFTGFAPPHLDYGYDENGNDLYDYLVVEARINVSVPGNYWVVAELFDQDGDWISSVGDLFYLSLGLYYVQLRFEGFEIRASMINGPYNVTLVMMDDEYNWVDMDFHTTGMYYWDDFETAPAELTPPYDDIGIDTDGSGLYDVLEVEISVEVYEAGFYRLVGGLYDMSHAYIDYQDELSFLDVGTHTVALDFFGPGINGHGVDGPYVVELELCDLNYSTIDTDTYYTSAYGWDEFDPLPAVLVPPYGEYTVDLDSDGLYDYLVITVPVEVYVAGVYYLWGNVMDPLYNFTADVWNYTYLDVGMHVVELRIPGWAINMSGFDGPYEVYFELDDDFWHMLDYDWYVTEWYSHFYFDGPPAWFAPPHSDFGVDTDGDSLYDQLAVNAAVYVDTPGVYSVTADLYDEFGMYLLSVTNTTYLDSGSNTIGNSFPGWMFNARGTDCAYLVDLRLEDADYYIVDRDTHFTGFYGHDEFDPEVPVIYSLYAPAAPVVDGVLSAGEWDGATVVDIGGCDPQNQLDGLMLVMNNATHLFLCYDVVGDMTEDPYDKVTASFDTGNDYALTDRAEDQFLVGTVYGYQQDTWHAVYSTAAGDWMPDCVPFDQSRPGHAGLEGARGFGPSDNSVLDHRVYELAIPLELLGATSGDTLGFAVASSYAPGLYDAVIMAYRWSSWPCAAFGPLPLEAYGDLVLAAAPETTASLDGTLGPNDWYLSDVTVTLTASGGQGGIDYTMYRIDGGAWQTYSVPFDVTSDGSHTVEYYSVDHGGYVEPTKSVAFDIDQNAPVTAELLMGTGAGEWWSTDVTVQLSADDGAGSGTDLTMYRVDGGSWELYTVEFVVTGLGSHEVEFYSVDLAGNEETAVSVFVKIEKTPPTSVYTLAGTMGDDGWYTSGVTLALAASDNVGGSGIGQTRYRIDGGAWQTYASTISVSATGSHVVEYYSVDNAGNIETAKTVLFKVDAADPTSSHSLAGTAGQDGWYTSAVAMTLAAEDGTGSSGVSDIRYRMASGVWQTYTAPISVSDDGTFVVEYYAMDNAGNSEAANSVTVKVDKTDPMTISSVQDATVTLAASDGMSGVSGTLYRIDRGSWQDYTAAFTVTGKGNHTIEYYSVDNAGNSEDIKTTWVEIGGGGGISGAAILGIIAAVVIVAAVVVVLLLMRRKKAPEAPEEPSQPAEPPSQ